MKSISNVRATDYTDLLTGEIVHQSLVWRDIKESGLQEPLLIVIGYDNKTIRLESGNHRIKTAIEDGYTHLPVAILVIKENILNRGNGTHFFDAIDLVKWDSLISSSYPYQVDPRKVIQSNLIL